MNKRYLFLPVLLLISALALAACGSSGSSEESQVEEAIETAATSNDPSKCTEVETEALVEQSTGQSGSAAVKQCEEEAKEEENAESVEISNVEVEGEEATADVAVTGSALDGQTLEVGMVKEGGQWKVNEFISFAVFNKAKLVEALENQLTESGEVSESLASCVIEGIEEGSREEVEELVLNGASGFEELAKECS